MSATSPVLGSRCTSAILGLIFDRLAGLQGGRGKQKYLYLNLEFSRSMKLLRR